MLGGDSSGGDVLHVVGPGSPDGLGARVSLQSRCRARCRPGRGPGRGRRRRCSTSSPPPASPSCPCDTAGRPPAARAHVMQTALPAVLACAGCFTCGMPTAAGICDGSRCCWCALNQTLERKLRGGHSADFARPICPDGLSEGGAHSTAAACAGKQMWSQFSQQAPQRVLRASRPCPSNPSCTDGSVFDQCSLAAQWAMLLCPHRRLAQTRSPSGQWRCRSGPLGTLSGAVHANRGT